MRKHLSIAVMAGGLLAAPLAHAQQQPTEGGPANMLALGIGMAPEYAGSDDLEAVPFLLGRVQLGGVDVEFRGQSLRVDLSRNERLSFGAVLGARMGREDAGGAVGLLPEIDTAVEAGAFVGYRIGGDAGGQGAVRMELSLLHDISDTHDGMLATASVSYDAIRRQDFFLALDMQTTWVNSDYARSYFGIDAAGSAASGLAEYTPGSGFRDVGLGVTAGYWFSPQFGVIGRAGASYLVGDAADSPITEDGDRWQLTTGLAVAYRF